MARTQTAEKKPMNATSTFSLGFAPVLESKIEPPDRLLDRQTLQRIATVISLISQAIGFTVLGMLIIVNQHQADLNGLSGGSSFATVGGISAILVGTAFFVAACLYSRFSGRRSAAATHRQNA
jgi:hypothetical protein